MITVTRLNGPAFALNPDLIERIEATPDTVITLVDGANYVVARQCRRDRRARARVEGRGHRACRTSWNTRPVVARRCASCPTATRRFEMAKKKKAESAEGGGRRRKPKSKKKLIIMVTVIVLIGRVRRPRRSLLKPKPPTAGAGRRRGQARDVKLENMCASHNGLPEKPLPADARARPRRRPRPPRRRSPPTPRPAGPVDSLDSITINLAAGHFLKVGLALQVPAGVDPDDGEDHRELGSGGPQDHDRHAVGADPRRALERPAPGRRRTASATRSARRPRARCSRSTSPTS